MEPQTFTSADLLLALVSSLNLSNLAGNPNIDHWIKEADTHLKSTISMGVNLIESERLKQLLKHDYTLANDRKHENGELWQAAVFCITCAGNWWPDNWDFAVRAKIGVKPLAERYAIAGALLAAEIDRIMEQQVPGAKFDITTSARMVATQSLEGQLFESTLKKMGQNATYWANVYEYYKTGTLPKLTKKQQLAKSIADRIEHYSGLDNINIEQMAEQIAGAYAYNVYLPTEQTSATGIEGERPLFYQDGDQVYGNHYTGDKIVGKKTKTK